MKNCPYCKTEIRDDVKQCPHCNEWLEVVFDLWLIEAGDRQSEVISVLRQELDIGREKAVTLCREAGILVAGITLQKAEVLKSRLESAGAIVELRPADENLYSVNDSNPPAAIPVAVSLKKNWQGWKRMPAIYKVILLLAITAGGLLLLVVPRLEPPEKSKPGTPTVDVGTSFDAWYMCREFVTNRLKAPATASFPIYDDVKMREITKERVFAVDSFVDAENSFGAKIRTRFFCKVEYQGADMWKALQLDFYE